MNGLTKKLSKLFLGLALTLGVATAIGGKTAVEENAAQEKTLTITASSLGLTTSISSSSKTIDGITIDYANVKNASGLIYQGTSAKATIKNSTSITIKSVTVTDAFYTAASGSKITINCGTSSSSLSKVTETATSSSSAKVSATTGDVSASNYKYFSVVPNSGTKACNITSITVVYLASDVLSSVTTTGQTTNFTVGDKFSYGGTFKAVYNEDDTTATEKTPTITCKKVGDADFSAIDTSTTLNKAYDGATIRLSYTENDVTKSTDYTINVSYADPTSIYFEQEGETLNVGIGGSTQLNAYLMDDTKVDPTLVPSFESSDPTVATVSATGLVEGLAEGSTTITVSYTGLTSKTCTVNVTSAATMSIKDDDTGLDVVSPVEMLLGNTIHPVTKSFTAAVTGVASPVYAWSVTQDAGQDIISLSATDTAQVTITTLKAGSSTVTCEITGTELTSNFVVNVADSGITSITLKHDDSVVTSMSGYVGDEDYQLTADVVAVGKAQDYTGVTWSTSDSAVATVNNGLVHLVGVGGAVISATSVWDNTTKADFNVTVNASEVTGVAINCTAENAYVELNKTKTLTATVTKTGHLDETVTWSSSNTAVATINSTTGKVTPASVGVTTITATSTVDTTKKATLELWVRPASTIDSALFTFSTAEGDGGIIMSDLGGSGVTVSPINVKVDDSEAKSTEKLATTYNTYGGKFCKNYVTTISSKTASIKSIYLVNTTGHTGKWDTGSTLEGLTAGVDYVLTTPKAPTGFRYALYTFLVDIKSVNLLTSTVVYATTMEVEFDNPAQLYEDLDFTVPSVMSSKSIGFDIVTTKIPAYKPLKWEVSADSSFTDATPDLITVTQTDLAVAVSTATGTVAGTYQLKGTTQDGSKLSVTKNLVVTEFIARTLTGITISPANTQETAEEVYETSVYDVSDFTVTAQYSEGDDTDITSNPGLTWTVGADKVISTPLTTSDTTIQASYTEDSVTKTDVHYISVQEDSIASVSVNTAPTKEFYVVGETIDLTGMVLDITWASGLSGRGVSYPDTVAYNGSNMTADPADTNGLTVGNHDIEVTYAEKTTSYTIEVGTKVTYTKVTDITGLYNGAQVVIASANEEANYVAKAWDSGTTVKATGADDVVEFSLDRSTVAIGSSVEYSEYTVGVSKDGYTFKDNNDKYLVSSGTNGAGLKATSDGTSTSYVKTTDTEIDPDKTYYVYISETKKYVEVETPVVADIGNYFEQVVFGPKYNLSFTESGVQATSTTNESYGLLKWNNSGRTLGSGASSMSGASLLAFYVATPATIEDQIKTFGILYLNYDPEGTLPTSPTGEAGDTCVALFSTAKTQLLTGDWASIRESFKDYSGEDVTVNALKLRYESWAVNQGQKAWEAGALGLASNFFVGDNNSTVTLVVIISVITAAGITVVLLRKKRFNLSK